MARHWAVRCRPNRFPAIGWPLRSTNHGAGLRKRFLAPELFRSFVRLKEIADG